MTTSMSMPSDILDQLLSGYLDDALSGDERTRVEQLLQSDPNVRQELDSLVELRAALKAIDRADRPYARARLGRDFSQRIVDLAIEQASSEGVTEDHPLLLATETSVRGNNTVTRSPSQRWKRAAVAAAALAATTLLVASIRTPDDSRQSSNPLPLIGDIANLDSGSNAAVANEPRENTPEPRTSEAMESAIASSAIEPVSIEPAEAMTAPATPAAETPGPAMVASAATPATLAEPNAVPQTLPAAVTSSQPNATQKARPIAVLVLEIRRTDQGRLGDPIQTAMHAADIDKLNERPVNEAIVSSVTRSIESLAPTLSDAAAESGTVMYIEASAKRIDQFLLNLLADTEGIESVGLSLATDAPLIDIVESVEPIDPTSVRQSQSMEIGDRFGEASRTLANHLGSREFIPMNSDMVQLAGASATSLQTGPDFLSRVFVVVR